MLRVDVGEEESKRREGCEIEEKVEYVKVKGKGRGREVKRNKKK